VSARTRPQNQARLVRCSGCRVLVWLAGALPTTADAKYVCDTCTKAAEKLAASCLAPAGVTADGLVAMARALREVGR
jgi:hypothetical protein